VGAWRGEKSNWRPRLTFDCRTRESAGSIVAAVTGVAGSWSHSAGMAVNLPRALQRFGLLPPGV